MKIFDDSHVIDDVITKNILTYVAKEREYQWIT